jgi:hypothetical protein
MSEEVTPGEVEACAACCETARLHPSRTWREQRIVHVILCRAVPPIPHRRVPTTGRDLDSAERQSKEGSGE